ncbi:hypothetical protein NC652_009880 [Populus alba x Populus x berolinensis]|nr:hypothetical protein NC652_009880 [Populus alba x Populus x berolinensis]
MSSKRRSSPFDPLIMIESKFVVAELDTRDLVGLSSIQVLILTEEPCLEVSSYWLNGPGGRPIPSNCDSISSLNDSIKSPVNASKQFCSEELMEDKTNGARTEAMSGTA